MSDVYGSSTSLRRLLDEVATLLKEPSVAQELVRRGINTSIALTAAQGLAAYLDGRFREASDDLKTAGDEISARLARQR
jgi:chromosome condensin MukBEF complex kleisin-like MukF subunit